jgi:hypothetical protein
MQTSSRCAAPPPRGCSPALIDCFCAYCTENGLMANPTKCEVVVSVFSGGTSWAWSGRRSWTLPSADTSRTALAVADKFKYLGVELHGSKDIRAARCRPQAQPDGGGPAWGQPPPEGTAHPVQPQRGDVPF